MNILLIDDDEASNAYTEIMLNRSGLLSTLDVFRNGEKALNFVLELIPQQKIDFILLDINMPVMSGHEFLEALHNNQKNIPVVILSTSIIEEDEQEALKYDFVKGYLNKPISLENLQKLL
ncbi:response regulator [Flammeovirga sp. EKP202]|uniref:response regulator n=1 Tax=Flammeovirga sp. EKP202 TaxID=2770592 RepID=UPI00165F7337|nr:response regulator [Flammeovirga sp. EKP202]MBD0400974.1 response regulator [Flammeovirga sp. EKP202]